MPRAGCISREGSSVRKLLWAMVGWVIAAAPLQGQILHAGGPRPSFAVASIRPSPLDGDELEHSGDERPDSFTTTSMTLKQIIAFAYGITFDHQLSGEPAWVKTEKFNIVAKPDEAEVAALSKLSRNDLDEQMRLRLQSLLAERFQLKVSFKKKELPIFELVVAKGGLKCAKLVPSTFLTKLPPPRFRWTSFPPPPPPPPGYTPPSPEEARRLTQTLHLRTNFMPFWMVVDGLSHQPELDGRPVVDKTGLEGNYDCQATWSRAGSEGSGPSLFTAMQDQMGLKLEPSKGQLETVVVEHVERPSEN